MHTKMKVEIYGAGCDKFFQTVNSFRRAVRKCNVAGKVEEITDGKRIAAQGFLNLPAVFINDKLIIQGERVSEEKAGEFLREAILSFYTA